MNISRRSALITSSTAAACSLIPGRVLGANKKVNLAAIGLGNQGGVILCTFAANPDVNVVALCDVDIDSSSPIATMPNYGDQGWGKEEHTPAYNASLFPDVPKFRDFRKMFDQMGDDIDAVCIGVPDHSHFPIAMAAMMLGKHVYVEKPLARTFQECEQLMQAEKKFGVVTQMGNQGHSGANYFQFKAWKEAGIIKDVTHVDAYMNKHRRWHPWGNVKRFPQGESLPKGMDWDVWLGTTAKPHDFSEKLHYGNWRGWHQFGTGCFGDWGAHILDTIHEFLELGLPEQVSAKELEGRNDYIFPLESTINFKFPARNGMPAMDIDWYDGQNNKPPIPVEMEGRPIPETEPGKFIYSKEYIFQGNYHEAPLQIIPYDVYRDLLKAGKVSKDYGRHSSHHENFINACMGTEQTRSPFSVAGPLSQMLALGCIAQRLGGTLEFDREKKQITNNIKANGLLKDEVRKGWEQYCNI